MSEAKFKPSKQNLKPFLATVCIPQYGKIQYLARTLIEMSCLENLQWHVNPTGLLYLNSL